MKRNSVLNVLLLVIFSFMVATAASSGTQSGAILIRGEKIYTVTQGVIENGEILVRDGRIQEVGKSVTAPPDAQVFEAVSVIPGMIDAHTHMALRRSGRGRIPGPVTSEWKAVENLNLDDPMIQVALSGGVTSLITRSGSGIISSGQAVALKMKAVPDESMILKPYVDLKMAVRPLIRLRPGQTPQSVMGWYATASEYFRRAKVYLEQQEDYRAGRTSEMPTFDARLEALVAVLRGDVMVHAHSHYPSEIMMVMDLARQFGFIDHLALGHASESYPIAEVLAETNIIPVVGPAMIARFYGDTSSHNVVKELMDAGVSASIQTDKSREQFKDFREYGSFHIRHGLGEEQALQALTINGAKAMGLADRVGSIEAGKDADLVLLDGHPFDLTADRVERVFVDGVLEYERKEILQPDEPTPVGPFRPIKSNVKDTDTTFAITNAHIFTVSHGEIRDGTIVVENGTFIAVQAGGPVPDGMPVMDIGGRVVLPGWITARAFPNTWIGDIKWQVQNNEITEPIVPEMNARYAIDPWYPSFPEIRAVGLTAQNITPGFANLIGGSGVVIKTAGMDRGKMVRREPSSMVFSLTMETVRSWAGDAQIPVTLEAASRMIRQALDGAREYSQGTAEREYNQRFEALLPVLRREVPAIIHAKRTDEIREAMKIARDYDLRLIISGAVQAHMLADELAGQNVGVILGDTASNLENIRGGGEGYSVQAPAILISAGVKVSLFGPGGSRRGMPTGRLGGEPALNAAWAFRNGVPEQDALKMLTLNAAEMFDMDDRIGSIDVGKDADFMILEGHPFDYRVLPQSVYIDGKLVSKGEGQDD